MVNSSEDHATDIPETKPLFNYAMKYQQASQILMLHPDLSFKVPLVH